MKKKLALCLALVFVLALFGTVFAACEDTPAALTDEQLKSLLNEVKNYHISDDEITNKDYSLIAKVFIVGDKQEIVVDVKWTASTDKVTIAATPTATGFYKVTVGDRSALTDEVPYTLTATLVDGEGNAYKDKDGKEFSLTFNRKIEILTKTLLEIYHEHVIEAPVAGTAYTLALYQGSNKKVLYAKAEMDGYYIATTENVAEAAELKLEAATGGYYLKLGSKYITLKGRISNEKLSTSLSLTDAAETVFKMGSYGHFTTTVKEGELEGEFYLGTYSTYATISASAISYITDANVDVSQFPCRVLDNKAIVSGGNNPGGDNQQPATEAEILAALKNLAVGATLEGGPHTLQGTIKAIDSAYSDQYKNITVTIEVGAEKLEIQCFRLKGGEELKVGDTIKVTGTLKNYENKDGSGKLEFDAGCTYEKISGGDDPQPATGSVIAPSEAVADTAYKLAVIKADKTLYAKAEMDGYYIATSEAANEGADIYVEAAEGGYKLYFKSGSDKIYLGAQASGTHANIGLSSNGFPETVWAYDAEHKCFTVNLTLEGGEPTVYYMGSSGTYKTVSLSNSTKYTPGEGMNFVAALATGAVSAENGGGDDAKLPELGTAAATIDLTTNHCQGDTSSKTVTVNGITVTNEKGSSTTNVAIQNNKYSDRFYKSSNLTIGYTSAMTAIKIVCDDMNGGEYATGLDGLTIAGAKITHVGAIIVIQFDTATTSFEVIGLASQLRVKSIEVYTA